MADMANISLRSDDTIQVDHVLIPVSNADKNLVWRGDAAGVPIDGQIRLTANWERLKDGAYRLSAKLEIPVLETIGTAASSGYVAAPKVAYVMVGIFTMFAPARSTTADRANIVRMLAHAVCGASSVNGTGLDPNQGSTGDTFKSSAYPLPYGFIHLAMPN